MNYYEHHIGDYAEATAHLTFVEDAAYSRMIRKYYATEKPLPADVCAVQRLLCARTKSEKAAVVTVLNEFFVLKDDGWHNARCDAEIARYLLEELGMKVTHVPDGAQAVEAFLSRPEDFDLILMDIMMPVMNGYEATQAIRRQGGALGRAIPILAVTANSFAEDIQSSLAAGMNGHISKPIQPKTLEEALTACLGG